MRITGEMRVNLNEVPERVRIELLAVAYNSVVEFFKQPGVPEAFEAWKAEKAKRKAESNG